MSPGVVKTLNHVEGLSVLGKENGSRSQIDRVYGEERNYRALPLTIKLRRFCSLK